MDNGTRLTLSLMRLPEGGYVVQDTWYGLDHGRTIVQHFASTSIDDALKFMRDKILSIASQSKVPNGDRG